MIREGIESRESLGRGHGSKPIAEHPHTFFFLVLNKF
jgi:hypothetical protein